MAVAIINGRRANLPENAPEQFIREAGGIRPGRTMIRRTREGNYVVRPGSSVKVEDGDVFIDAPARIKG
jgi:hypothetical protein